MGEGVGLALRLEAEPHEVSSGRLEAARRPQDAVLDRESVEQTESDLQQAELLTLPITLVLAVVINLPLVLERIDLFYRHAFLQNLRADFSDLDQHLASRDASVRLLAKLPEPGGSLDR